MKPFSTLSNAELVALSAEEITEYIDYACAEQGIPLCVEELPELPTEKPVQPGVVVYEVVGLHFETMKAAEEVQRFVVSKGARKLEYHNYNYSRRILGEVMEPPAISTINVYSPEVAAKHDAALKRYEAQSDRYKTAQNKVRDLERKRDAAAKPFWDAIEKAKEQYGRRVFLETQFERYVKLAKGDRTVALRFLREAHPDSTDLCDHLFDSDPETAVTTMIHGLQVSSEAPF